MYNHSFYVFNTSLVISAATSQKIKVREFLLLQLLCRDTDSVVIIVLQLTILALSCLDLFLVWSITHMNLDCQLRYKNH